MIRRSIVVSIAVLAFAGCGDITDQYRQENDDLGKKTAADFGAEPGVASSSYRYTHGIDQGQNLTVEATLTAEADPADVPKKLLGIARCSYWLSSSAGLSMSVVVYDSQPPHDRISLEKVDVSDTAKLERECGPRPAKK